jgi:hypothetical protein
VSPLIVTPPDGRDVNAWALATPSWADDVDHAIAQSITEPTANYSGPDPVWDTGAHEVPDHERARRDGFDGVEREVIDR